MDESPSHHEAPEDDWARHWDLDPAVAFLNHGSFGACPRAIMAEQTRLRTLIEKNPMGFFLRDFLDLLDAARSTLAVFVGSQPANLVFVDNATTGVNTVLRSMTFAAGDEILVTDMGYPAVLNAVADTSTRTGARVVSAQVPFPIATTDQALNAVLSAVTPRTRLCVIDHVVSSTALVLPVAEIVTALEGAGIPCLVDGAHAVGMLPLALDALGASYYVSNAHKWLCTPKGSAFLHVRRDHQDRIQPLVISHGYRAPASERPPLWQAFDWTGTRDPTPWLCVGKAIRWFESLLPGGWEAIRARNHDLALRARRLIAERIGVALPCPDDMVGSMAVVPLPDAARPPTGTETGKMDALHHQLRARGLEVYVPYHPAPPRRLLRVAVQLYNTMAQYQSLAEAVAESLGKQR